MTKKRYTILAQCFDKKGKLISEAYNDYYKTHPVQARFANAVGEDKRIFLHAEILALLRAKERTVHRILITNLSSSVKAEPCKVCQAAIKEWKVKEVVLNNASNALSV